MSTTKRPILGSTLTLLFFCAAAEWTDAGGANAVSFEPTRQDGAVGVPDADRENSAHAARDEREEVATRRLMALEAMTNTPGESALRAFLDEHLAPDFVRDASRDALLKRLDEVRARCGNAGGIGLERDGEWSARMIFETERGRYEVSVDFEQAAPYRIVGFTLARGAEPPRLPAMSWGDVEARLEALEREGFSGAVLLVRDGEVVLDRGYGFANVELGARNGGDTLFAIGSTPIDFTKAAILLLEERGELDTGAPLSTYLDGVPADKAAITLEHLMTGRSGLRNFHGDREVDEDLDLAYIDRAEALRRIFASPLLFEPGTGEAHSHSAWGVLAAVVEVVSGRSYGEFLREELFAPAGLDRTGLYPLANEFPDDEVAVGQAPPALGRPNTPKNWGATSWLVMGSGGMVSTTHDLYQWVCALREGRVLGERALARYWSGGVLAGGNDRGFLTVYTEGPRTSMVLCSNSHHEAHDLEDQVARALAELVRR